ncbi:MAG: acetyl-CoA carboxylase biotin carboxyl carrier protein, partial [Hyphomicrobiaceae bacterium]
DALPISLAPAVALAPTPEPTRIAQAAPAAPAAPAQQPAAGPAPAATAPVADGTQVRAPMVGSFYRRPSPQEKPFVEVGSKVKKGDPLCLIEVMKLYTTIEAPVSGTVVAITAEDGKLVEFDQLLFVVKPD